MQSESMTFCRISKLSNIIVNAKSQNKGKLNVNIEFSLSCGISARNVVPVIDAVPIFDVVPSRKRSSSAPEGIETGCAD